MKPILRIVAALAVTMAGAVTSAWQETADVYQGAAAEQFLLKAKVTDTRDLGEGVTKPLKVTLEMDGATRSALFKFIELNEPGTAKLADGSIDTENLDTWQAEVAAYQVDRIIGLGMVPATVERRVANKAGSLQWWVESMMPEVERIAQRVTPPDQEAWSQLMLKTRLFDQLIANVDRHGKNLLVTKEFQIRLIDHSRSFRSNRDLRRPGDLTRFSRSLLDGIQRLEQKDLRTKLGRYLSNAQIERLLQRRDAILALAKKRMAELGEAAVIYP